MSDHAAKQPEQRSCIHVQLDELPCVGEVLLTHAPGAFDPPYSDTRLRACALCMGYLRGALVIVGTKGASNT
jgi:hypothetical protein